MIKVVKQFDPDYKEFEFKDKSFGVFLAGGISNINKDWRKAVIDELIRLDNLNDEIKKEYELVIYNPNEAYDKIDINTKSMDEIVKWDMDKLMFASAIKSFYFVGGNAAQTSSQVELFTTLIDDAYTLNDDKKFLPKYIILGIEDDYINKDKLLAYLKYIVIDDPAFEYILNSVQNNIVDFARKIYDCYLKYIDYLK